MTVAWLFAVLIALSIVGFIAARTRAMASAGGDMRNLHSLPSYYGSTAMLAVIVPSFIVLFAWLILQPIIIGPHRRPND
ncbi:MAG: phosphate ABC transporter permease family protein, partial [Pseudomonadota bacterium]